MQSEKRLGDFFRKRSEKGRPGLPLLSVTMNNGLVHRDTLERKTESNLRDEDHLLIRQGDIAYNMMRMWQGASGLAERDGIVSPAYVVVAPKDGIDALFASYWFKSPRMIYLFWAYSYGLTKDRLRLYFNDFAKVPAALPALGEQKRIGATLRACDQAIEQTERLIRAKRRLKQGLMQELLTGQRRFPEFAGQSWPARCLSEIGSFAKGKGFGKSDLVEGDGVPAILYGELYTTYDVAIRNVRSRVSPTTAAKSTHLRRGDILFPSSGETADEIAKPAVYLGPKGAVAGGDIVVFRPRDGHPLFLSFALNAQEAFRYRYRVAQGQSIVHIYRDNLAKHPVPFPRVAEQKRIASALDAVGREIALLEQERRLLVTEKRGLMQKVLTGEVRVKGAERGA